MADYKVNFKELKSRVGVDDVAYALGYRLDRKAGVGRYIELVLGSGSEKQDTLVVSNPHNKAAQTFFRRDGSKEMWSHSYVRIWIHSLSPVRMNGRR